MYIKFTVYKPWIKCRKRAGEMQLYAEEQSDVARARKLIMLAMDKEGKVPNADLVQLYRNAGKTCLEFSRKHPRKKDDLQKMAIQAVERAETLQSEEQLKNLHLPDIPGELPKPSVLPSPKTPSPPKVVSPTANVPSGPKFTKEELEIIKMNSKINGNVYVPFEPRDASKSALFVPGGSRWKDPAGILALSAKQQKRLENWHHAEEKVRVYWIKKSDSLFY